MRVFKPADKAMYERMIKGSHLSDKWTIGLYPLALSFLEAREQFGDRPGTDRIDGIGRDFRERLQDKAANRHSGMRYRQLSGIHDLIAEEQQVKVHRPLAPADCPDAAEPLFDLLKDMEQPDRIESRLQHGGSVQEHPLTGWPADRFGLVKRTHLTDNHAFGTDQGCDRRVEHTVTVAQIAPQGDIREICHMTGAS
jgi:hypothetical protein